jgi:transposase
MAKYKRYDYSQSVLIPVSLEEQLVPGTLEFAIHTLVDSRMDMSIFDDNYQNDETGRSAYDPKILLKVVLLGYSRGLTSSRQIERACCENVLFMAMSCNQRPDHSTIAPFVSSMKDQIKPLFRDILLVCDQEGLLGGSFFAIDGCKMSSNASKEWSGKISDLQKRKQKIEGKLKALVEDHIEIDKEEHGVQLQKNQSAVEFFGTILGRGFSPLMDERAVVDWHELLETSENRNVQMAEKLDTQLATDLLKLPFIPEDDIQSLASRNLLRGQTFLLPSGENIARAIQRPDSEIDNISQSTKSIASEAADLTNGTPLWFYILREAKEIGRETNPGEFEPGEGLGPVGARIVAETMIGLIELDSRSYLAKNRNWSPDQGVGVASLGEMLTYQPS